MSRVVVTGATGTIGRALCRALVDRGDEVVALSRREPGARELLGEEVEVHAWAYPLSTPPPQPALEAATAVVHLLGEPLDQRWSEQAKARIRDSRVLGTRMLVQGLRRLPHGERPSVLISQSVTGFYGPSDKRELDERAPGGEDFLARVVEAWEAEAHRADDMMRVVCTRTGVVLTRSGGALARMLPFFRAGLGGPVAGGKQYVPWIHIDDVVAGILFCLAHDDLRGPVNLTAPRPVTNAELAGALGRVLRRPAVLPVPALALRLLYGEMAMVVTTGQRAVPVRLTQAGFSHRHPDIEAALRDALS